MEILELQKSITKINKNSVIGFNKRMEGVEERISDLRNRTEITKSLQQRK